MGPTQFHVRLRAPAVIVGEGVFDVADLILLGLRTGAWTHFEDGVQRGLALAALDLPAPTEREISASATAFRYRHGLVSGNEFAQWLRDRSVTVSDVSAVILRQLLCEREEGRSVEPAMRDSTGIVWVEAVFSGVLRELALLAADLLAAAHRHGIGDGPEPDEANDAELDALVGRAMSAAAVGLAEVGEDEIRARAIRLHRIAGSLEQLRAEVADEAAVGRCLAGHQLDWLQVSGEELAVASEGAAREARLLVIDDGLLLADVAERARMEIRTRRITLDRAAPEASALIAAAAPGEVAGPWLEDDCWRLMLVASKSSPSARVPAIRERASQELVREVLDRTLAGRLERPLAL